MFRCKARKKPNRETYNINNLKVTRGHTYEYTLSCAVCSATQQTMCPSGYERFSTAPLFFLLESTASAVFIIYSLFPFGGGNFPAIRFLLQRYIEVPHAERLRDHVGRGAGLVSTGQDSLKYSFGRCVLNRYIEIGDISRYLRVLKEIAE